MTDSSRTFRSSNAPDSAAQGATDPDAIATFDGVLFDLDGVLTPTADVHMRAWQSIFDDLFAAWKITPAYTDDDYYRYVDGKKRYDGVAAVLRSRNVEVPWGDPSDADSADTVCGIGNRKNAVFTRVLASEGIAPYPGSLRLLDALRARGVRMGVVSSSKNAGDVLEAAGIADRFDALIDGRVAERDELASKPAGDMYLAGASALGTAPERTLGVEDALSGVASCAAAGLALVIGVNRGAGAQSLLDAGADIVVNDLAELLADG